MQYLGGKVRVSKVLAPEVNRIRAGRFLWEPFCGGLGMTTALGGRGCASDAHVALIALYRGCLSGWEPPTTVTAEQYAAAEALPDTDPLKAFIGFGCSYGGKYFGGYARDPKSDRNYAANCRSSLARTLGACTGFTFESVDFNELNPWPTRAMIYCDPPYAGTTGYGFAFDHAAFYARIAEWSHYTDIVVSEYGLPLGECVFEVTRNLEIGGNNAQPRGTRTERLFLIRKGSY